MGLLLEVLRSVDFLAEAPEKAARFMVLGRCADHARGHVLWRIGDPARDLVIPVSGEAETVSRDEDGHQVIDRFVGPGECLGFVSALDGGPRTFEATVSRGGEFFSVDRAAFLRFVDSDPDVRHAVDAMVGRQYRHVVSERDDLAFRRVGPRAARFLLERACVLQAGGARVLLHASHAEIAAHLGTVREVYWRALADLERQGLVERAGGFLFVADWDGLCALAETDPRDPARRREAADRTHRFFLPLREPGGARDEDGAQACAAARSRSASCAATACPIGRSVASSADAARAAGAIRARG